MQRLVFAMPHIKVCGLRAIGRRRPGMGALFERLATLRGGLPSSTRPPRARSRPVTDAPSRMRCPRTCCPSRSSSTARRGEVRAWSEAAGARCRLQLWREREPRTRSATSGWPILRAGSRSIWASADEGARTAGTASPRATCSIIPPRRAARAARGCRRTCDSSPRASQVARRACSRAASTRTTSPERVRQASDRSGSMSSSRLERSMEPGPPSGSGSRTLRGVRRFVDAAHAALKEIAR